MQCYKDAETIICDLILIYFLIIKLLMQYTTMIMGRRRGNLIHNSLY